MLFIKLIVKIVTKKYIGETSRNLKTRMKEQQRDVQQGKELS